MLINFTPVRARLVYPTAGRVSLEALAAFITVQPLKSCREHKAVPMQKAVCTSSHHSPKAPPSHDIPASLARLGDYMLVPVNRQLPP